MLLFLWNFPMPPSVNRLYIRRGGTGRGMRCSDEYVAYKAAAEAWRLSHLALVRKARAALVGGLLVDPRLLLRVEARFRFYRSKILLADGSPARLDTENRMKALLDAVAPILGIDDSLFWAGTFDKEPITERGETEGVNLRISDYRAQPWNLGATRDPREAFPSAP